MSKIWGWEQEDLEKTPLVTLLLFARQAVSARPQVGYSSPLYISSSKGHRFYKWNCSTKQTDTFKLPYTLTAYNKLFS